MQRLSINKLLSPNITVLLGPLLVLFIVIALFFIVVNKGYSQIKIGLDNLNSVQDEEKLLKEKLDKLKEVRPNILDSTSSLVVALPEKNSGLLLISQVRKFSNNNSLNFKKVELNNLSNLSEGFNKMELNTEFEIPDHNSVVKYLNDISNAAPISSFGKLTIKPSDEGIIQAEIGQSFFWADLPKELPALTESFQNLSQEEENLLLRVTNLSQPEFTVLPPTEPNQRENPFN